jgi:hypothetical protein
MPVSGYAFSQGYGSDTQFPCCLLVTTVGDLLPETLHSSSSDAHTGRWSLAS